MLIFPLVVFTFVICDTLLIKWVIVVTVCLVSEICDQVALQVTFVWSTKPFTRQFSGWEHATLSAASKSKFIRLHVINQIYCWRIWWLTSWRVTYLRICSCERLLSSMVENLIRYRFWISLPFIFSDYLCSYLLTELAILMIKLLRNPWVWQPLSVCYLSGCEAPLKFMYLTFRWISVRVTLRCHSTRDKTVGTSVIA